MRENTADILPPQPKKTSEPTAEELSIKPEGIELPDERPILKRPEDAGLAKANEALDKLVKLNQESMEREEPTKIIKEKITQAIVDADIDTVKIEKHLARIYQETARENKNLTENTIEGIIKEQVNIIPMLIADEDIAILWQDAFDKVFND